MKKFSMPFPQFRVVCIPYLCSRIILCTWLWRGTVRESQGQDKHQEEGVGGFRKDNFCQQTARDCVIQRSQRAGVWYVCCPEERWFLVFWKKTPPNLKDSGSLETSNHSGFTLPSAVSYELTPVLKAHTAVVFLLKDELFSFPVIIVGTFCSFGKCLSVEVTPRKPETSCLFFSLPSALVRRPPVHKELVIPQKWGPDESIP